jgi:hypothetical protein
MQAIYVHHVSDVVYRYTDGRLVRIDADYHAIGSGQDYAYGAFACGANAEQAVEAAAQFDVCTGREFNSVKTDARIAEEVRAMEKIASAREAAELEARARELRQKLHVVPDEANGSNDMRAIGH